MIAETEKLLGQLARSKPREAVKDQQRVRGLRKLIDQINVNIEAGQAAKSMMQRLLGYEAELERLEMAPKAATVQKLVPKVRERFQRLLGRLDSLLVLPPARRRNRSLTVPASQNRRELRKPEPPSWRPSVHISRGV